MTPWTSGEGRRRRGAAVGGLAASLAAGALVASALLGCDPEVNPGSPPDTTPFDLACNDGAASPTPLRRLTRFEYGNAVRDVFGLEASFDDLLPRDEIALGFDNQAGTLSVTDLHVEGYLKAAERISAWLLERPSRLASLAGCELSAQGCADALIAALGPRLFRRPLSEAETQKLRVLFDSVPSDPVDGATRVVAALLQAPEFLYRFERAKQSGTGVEDQALASPWVLAGRLAGLFWASAPDQELLDRAGTGRLASGEDAEREARRLLADPRAKNGVLHFYEQWLSLDAVEELEKDQALFTRWDEQLRADLKTEAEQFLRAVLWEDDGRFETLMTARYSVVNPALMDFYGLPIENPSSDAFELVRFGADVPRSGLLTRAALLSMLAGPDQTSPVHRGKFIREKFFCSPPPPPPPNVAATPPRLDPRATTRERFAQHRADPACASCHELLDPIGLVFENYDAIGRYRETEAGVAIDAEGYLVDTDVDGTVTGVDELSSRLLQSGQVRRCIITQWFRYAMGRGEDGADECAIDELEKVYERSRGNLQELLVALTRTDAFLRPSPAPEEDSP